MSDGNIIIGSAGCWQRRHTDRSSAEIAAAETAARLYLCRAAQRRADKAGVESAIVCGVVWVGVVIPIMVGLVLELVP